MHHSRLLPPAPSSPESRMHLRSKGQKLRLARMFRSFVSCVYSPTTPIPCLVYGGITSTRMSRLCTLGILSTHNSLRNFWSYWTSFSKRSLQWESHKNRSRPLLYSACTTRHVEPNDSLLINSYLPDKLNCYVPRLPSHKFVFLALCYVCHLHEYSYFAS